ncbi:hypothetical protein CJG89_002837 [Salmonella enterica subsp. enterica serovar Hato]|nr:hypothetical protein [Salmonella enterica]EBF8309781.1 hypothetical protein [Salmonella enterica subsp. enterica serovar Tamberma]EBG2970594.1 hypothetical protein [Salmonella enterica subsp. enterica]EBG4980936.1 hypothetical protein [Salmonella enterica subsp. enterica serovar Tennessee]ECG3794408.1 hypothetical protein [Salmonella enterica subsp. enterica serovar Menston]ECK9471487.1 hypothetical protein [Salmonella enterica subsp. enterica serovar Wien str. CFSAN000657]EDP9480607.1 hyp
MVSPGSTFAPAAGLPARRTSFRPDIPSTPRLSAPRSPWTIGPPSAVISFWRAAGFPLITQFLLLFNLM